MDAPTSPPRLVCPAGSLRALKLAVEAGADAVYCGLRDATNARNFAGLNFDTAQLREGLRTAHAQGAEVYLALNTQASAADPLSWRRAVDLAADLGVDALIVADLGILGYAARTHPGLALHLSVQASATTAGTLEHLRRRYRIRRAVLPRVLSLMVAMPLLVFVGDVMSLLGAMLIADPMLDITPNPLEVTLEPEAAPTQAPTPATSTCSGSGPNACACRCAPGRSTAWGRATPCWASAS